MTRGKVWAAWNLVMSAACAAVVVFASPAAAAETSSTGVQASPSAATVGQYINLTATVTCPDDPSIGLGMTFWDGGDILDTVSVSTQGIAGLSVKLTTVGTHEITAAYNGNANCGASHAEMSVVASAAPVIPTPPNGLCLLACTGLFNFNAGDVHNEVNIYPGRRGSSAHHTNSHDFAMQSAR